MNVCRVQFLGSAVQIVRNAKSHVSDRALVLVMDAEIPRGESGAIEHLSRCVRCRGQVESFRRRFRDFSQAYQDCLVPDRSTALASENLRRQLALGGTDKHRLVWIHFHLSGPWTERWARIAPAALLVAVAAAGSILPSAHFRHPSLFRPEGEFTAAVPRPDLTPGDAVLVSRDDVCRSEPVTGAAENISPAVQREVLAAYGVRDSAASSFELDRLITPDLGGTNSPRNLWPQPYTSEWNARAKDDLEIRLHQMVCAGNVDVATAQREIATDWIAAYKKYFQTNKPLAFENTTSGQIAEDNDSASSRFIASNIKRF